MKPMPEKKAKQRLIVGISGASGAIYGIRLLEVLREMDEVETCLVITDAARLTINLETGMSPEQVEALADQAYDINDISAAIASGSFRTAGMVVAPCTIKTLSGIAGCCSNNLLQRAGDVTLKERRRLVLVVRESPLHLGHLRLMAQATEMGAVIVPPVPAFYNHPASLDDIVNHITARVLDLLGIERDQDLAPRWK